MDNFNSLDSLKIVSQEFSVFLGDAIRLGSNFRRKSPMVEQSKNMLKSDRGKTSPKGSKVPISLKIESNLKKLKSELDQITVSGTQKGFLMKSFPETQTSLPGSLTKPPTKIKPEFKYKSTKTEMRTVKKKLPLSKPVEKVKISAKNNKISDSKVQPLTQPPGLVFPETKQAQEELFISIFPRKEAKLEDELNDSLPEVDKLNVFKEDALEFEMENLEPEKKAPLGSRELEDYLLNAIKKDTANSLSSFKGKSKSNESFGPMALSNSDSNAFSREEEPYTLEERKVGKLSHLRKISENIANEVNESKNISQTPSKIQSSVNEGQDLAERSLRSRSIKNSYDKATPKESNLNKASKKESFSKDASARESPRDSFSGFNFESWENLRAHANQPRQSENRISGSRISESRPSGNKTSNTRFSKYRISEARVSKGKVSDGNSNEKSVSFPAKEFSSNSESAVPNSDQESRKTADFASLAKPMSPRPSFDNIASEGYEARRKTSREDDSEINALLANVLRRGSKKIDPILNGFSSKDQRESKTFESNK